MKFKCDWCKAENKIEGMVSSAEMPVVCSKCGTKLGYIDYKDLNNLIKELKYWKDAYKRCSK